MTAQQVIEQRCPNFRPRVGVVLGSGLGGLAEQLTKVTAVSYGELPGFPTPGVSGHPGQLLLGRAGRIYMKTAGPMPWPLPSAPWPAWAAKA